MTETSPPPPEPPPPEPSPPESSPPESSPPAAGRLEPNIPATLRAPAVRDVPTSVHPTIIIVSVVITILHLLLTVVGLAVDTDTVRNGVAVGSVAGFFVGAFSFMAAFVIAAGRSRYEELWFGGAFFLTGGVVAPRARRWLLGCLVVQCAVGLLGASLAPFTPVAFVVLVPLAAMGLTSLYGARWGEFSPKPEDG